MIATIEIPTPVVKIDDKPPGDVMANFRVPVEPRARSLAGEKARDVWLSWLHQFRIFWHLGGGGVARRPCRIEAVVRRCAGGIQRPVTPSTLDAWEDGIREAAIRSHLVRPDDLRGVSVRFAAVRDVPLVERPHVDGTHIVIVAL